MYDDMDTDSYYDPEDDDFDRHFEPDPDEARDIREEQLRFAADDEREFALNMEAEIAGREAGYSTGWSR